MIGMPVSAKGIMREDDGGREPSNIAQDFMGNSVSRLLNQSAGMVVVGRAAYCCPRRAATRCFSRPNELWPVQVQPSAPAPANHDPAGGPDRPPIRDAIRRDDHMHIDALMGVMRQCTAGAKAFIIGWAKTPKRTRLRMAPHFLSIVCNDIKPGHPSVVSMHCPMPAPIRPNMGIAPLIDTKRR